MKIFNTISIYIFLAILASCQEVRINQYELEAMAHDVNGEPIEGIMVITGRSELIVKEPFPMTRSKTTDPVKTGPDGKVLIHFNSVMEATGNISFYHDKFYTTTVRNTTWQMPDGPEGEARKANVSASMKAVKNPIPMYAYCNMGAMQKAVNIPKFDVQYGFDLQMAEALPPLGNGKVADFIFILSGRHDGENGHDLRIEIIFPGEHNGVVEFITPERTAMREPVMEGSMLLSDHEAPKEGYISKLVRKDLRPNGELIGKDKTNVQRNFYFRTRSESDKSGKLIRANYGKIYGDFYLLPAKLEWGYLANFVVVTSYFNPTPNDRNVEFDTTRNLIPDANVERP